MPTCFVMQPFDGATFDRRYEEVFAPAIKAAGLEPYRVDKDPKVSIPIQEIENGIRESQICLAEITLDNPNVWFELGYAIACGKEVVLVCSDERTTRFPFDVQHRTIIKYSTRSPSDFEKVKSSIKTKIDAFLQKEESLAGASIASKLVKIEGLEQYQVVALAAIAENLEEPGDHVTLFQIKRDMESSGFTKFATTLALKTLSEKGLISYGSGDYEGNEFNGYTLSDIGWSWVLDNRDKFVLEKPIEEENDTANDIPF